MTELVVISGPSGVGKSTITRGLMEQEPLLERVRSATTREKRFDDERDKPYDYLSEQEFLHRVDEGAFLEWAEVHGEYYGTPHSELERVRNDGCIPILEIDVQGAEQIRESGCRHISFFIEPPTYEDLESRLRSRGFSNEEELQRRLRMAEEELAAVPDYDFRIVNDRVEQAVHRVLNIIRFHVSFSEETNHGTETH